MLQLSERGRGNVTNKGGKRSKSLRVKRGQEKEVRKWRGKKIMRQRKVTKSGKENKQGKGWKFKNVGKGVM